MYDDRFTDGYLVGASNGNNNNGWNDWSWIIGLAVVGGIFGNGGFGFGNNGNRGACATQADLSAGFNNSAVLSNLNDIILGQAQMQNFINQGFAGLNSTINTGFAGVDNAVCTLGYNTQAGFNALATQIAQCCCDTRSAIADVKYANERCRCNNLLWDGQYPAQQGHVRSVGGVSEGDVCQRSHKGTLSAEQCKHINRTLSGGDNDMQV